MNDENSLESLVRMKELIQEISECRNEIRSLKSIVRRNDFTRLFQYIRFI